MIHHRIKHYIYEYNIDRSVLPSELCNGHKLCQSGSKADIEIFCKIFTGKKNLRKFNFYSDIDDSGELCAGCDDFWGIMVRKEYTGAP